jgi:hypothetical protein
MGRTCAPILTSAWWNNNPAGVKWYENPFNTLSFGKNPAWLNCSAKRSTAATIKGSIKPPGEVNQALADMHEDRRAGINPLIVKKPVVTVTAPQSFSITPGTPILSLPKPKKGLGGFVSSDGSVKVDI